METAKFGKASAEFHVTQHSVAIEMFEETFRSGE